MADRWELTPREVDVARHLLAGHSDKEIASSLAMARATVHSHLHNIYKKAEVQSRGEFVARANQYLLDWRAPLRRLD